MRRAPLAILIALALALAACGPAAPEATPTPDPDPVATPTPDTDETPDPGEAVSRPDTMTPITVLFPQQAAQPDWPHLWVAIELGYFAEENLDVTIQTTGGSADSARLLSVGQGDIALGGSEALLLAVAQGADLRAVYTHQQGTIFGVAVLEDSPYETMADLQGQTIGIASFGSGGYPIARALLQEEGIDPDDAEYVEVGVGAAAASALATGQIDAASHWDTMFYVFEQEGLSLRVFRSDRFDDFFASTVNVRAETLEESPEVVEAFLRAFNKGLIFALENPDAAIEAMGRLEPAVLENQERSVGIMQTRADQTWGLPPEADGLLGWNTVERWEIYQDFLLETDQLDEPVDVAAVWDDRLLEAAMAFDEEEIRQQARDW